MRNHLAVGADANKALYRRWLVEIWGAGDVSGAEEILAADLLDHTHLSCPIRQAR